MKIYFDKEIIKRYNKEWVPFLYPILGSVPKENRTFTWYYDNEQIQKWIRDWKNLIKFENDISKCDYIIFPIGFHFDYLDSLENQCKLWKKHNKKILVFYFNDNEQPIPNKYSNLIVYRVSLSKNNPENEFAMPWFTSDFWKIYWVGWNDCTLSIGYTGYCGYYNIKTLIEFIFIKLKFILFDNKFIYKFILHNSWLTNLWIKLENLWLVHDWSIFRDSLLYFLTAKWKWYIYRSNIIKKLLSLKGIKFNLIERKKMLNVQCDSNLKREYVNNIKNSLYPLVMRWNGNYSYRLSEVLSLWKIPLFVDTDCRLPFDKEINYKKLFCWFQYSDSKIEEIEIIKHFNMQNMNMSSKEMRFIYDKYFSFYWFHNTIIKHLWKNF